MNDEKTFRQCLGKFATGVAVVTCSDAAGDPCGITANSFSSVSLDPPLVLWNIAKVSNFLDAYLKAEHFAINVLSEKQQALSIHFARSDHTKFNGIDYTLSGDGAPLLPEAIATFHCRTHQTHDCGDHHIIIGEVIACQSTDRNPLLFYGGEYCAIKS